MSHPTDRRGIALVAACLALFSIVGCSGLAPGPRTSSPVADERLAALLADYRAADGALVVVPREEVIVDSGRIRNDIERLTVEFPHHVPSLMASAQLAYDHRERTKAAAFLDRVRDLDPGHADAAVLRARVALDEGSLPMARRLVDEQLDRSPDHAGLREVEASVRFLSGDYSAAQRALDAAAALGAPPHRILYHRGLIEEKRGAVAAAAALYQQAAEAGNPRAAARRRGLSH